MCIPITLDVPVVSVDGTELGIARDILCANAHAESPTSGTVQPAAIRWAMEDADLWLRVERRDGPDLFVPFGEIVETRSDGVELAISADEADRRRGDRPPPGLPVREGLPA
jgi:hypothetical protein